MIQVGITNYFGSHWEVSAIRHTSRGHRKLPARFGIAIRTPGAAQAIVRPLRALVKRIQRKKADEVCRELEAFFSGARKWANLRKYRA
jgi:hypothetical protein